ncbi:DUF934 domain-containing protein [Dongia sp.]|uniref:DUF934 domain-containing protein n=1 Tax=Dongia sp. TaxID=1977262 RepID=UPI0035B23FAA
MTVLRNGVPQPNEWVRVADDATLPEGAKVIVSLERWRNEHEGLRQRNAAVGVSLKSDQSPLLLAEDLHHLSLVALEFPKFTDGRAFSYARVLRDRLSYRGEIRAFGQVLRDQYLFMLRCGIDTIEPPAEKRVEGYAEALNEFSVFYQPAGDQRETALHLRHGLPRVAESAAA